MKLRKPFAENKNYNCFGCSPNNIHGLQMDFEDRGDLIYSEWKPDRKFEGFENILHGGIQSALLDEIAAWCIQVHAETSGVTSRLNIQYLKPVRVNQGNITLTASISKRSKRIVTVDVKLYSNEGVLCTSGEIDYFVYPKEVAERKLKYPGKEAYLPIEERSE